LSFTLTTEPKIISTKPLERLSGEIKRRIEVVGIFPTHSAIVCLVAGPLREHNKE
jgi:transposase-like protein